MLKRKRVGFIIWGAIILGVSFLTLIVSLISISAFYQLEYGMHYAAYSSEQATVSATVFGILAPFLALGTVFLVLGIVNCCKVTRYNNDLIAMRGPQLTGTCIYCHNIVTISRVSFRAHRNYPEGFAYCPICRGPLSRSVFERG